MLTREEPVGNPVDILLRRIAEALKPTPCVGCPEPCYKCPGVTPSTPAPYGPAPRTDLQWDDDHGES